MRKILIHLLLAGSVFSLLCACKGNETDPKESEADKIVVTQVIVPSTLECEPSSTVVITLRGKCGILAEDKVILRDAAGTEYTMPLASVTDGSRFSFCRSGCGRWRGSCVFRLRGARAACEQADRHHYGEYQG